MLRWFRIFTFGLLACHVAACATVNPEQRAAACAQTDWQRYGENDGRLGVATAERAREFESCAAVGQPADLTAYQTGRSKGLETYCTAENGYVVGREGRPYSNVCPQALAQDFEQGLERGRSERPAIALAPRIGIGIGSGGRVGVGIGIGLGRYYGDHYYASRYHRDRYERYCRRSLLYDC